MSPCLISSTLNLNLGEQGFDFLGFNVRRHGLPHVQSLGHDPITGADALDASTGALTTATGTRVPGLQLAGIFRASRRGAVFGLRKFLSRRQGRQFPANSQRLSCALTATALSLACGHS
jgi:hypothetical protein